MSERIVICICFKFAMCEPDTYFALRFIMVLSHTCNLVATRTSVGRGVTVQTWLRCLFTDSQWPVKKNRTCLGLHTASHTRDYEDVVAFWCFQKQIDRSCTHASVP